MYEAWNESGQLRELCELNQPRRREMLRFSKCIVLRFHTNSARLSNLLVDIKNKQRVQIDVVMEPTSSNLAMQVNSVERSIVFLRQEHLTLLHGLHLEILSLQKRCTELTCELNVKPPGKSQLDLAVEEEQLEARCLEMENRLTQQQCSLGDLRKELGHKGALVGALRSNLKEKERRFLDELKRRSHRSTVLNTELQKQSEAAAYLSFQLHGPARSCTTSVCSRDSRPSGRTVRTGIVTAEAHMASPPVVKPKRKSSRAMSGHQFRAERARECVPQERVTGPAEPTAMPDPALFLYPQRMLQRSRAKHSHSPAHRQPPLAADRGEEERGGEGPMEPQNGAPSRLAATAPPAGCSGHG
ncbi:hypothetical protein UPYG_G00199610 [Umbra pygmaea]|uniref:CCDC92/74 N-terminal domain-containing protein n=1 Tax=Umbra pygmaea TaxID=75934 RepID=A0ABD0WHX6_UMBPY